VDGSSGPPLVVSARHPALAGHFPGNPMVPGTVILSRVADAIRQKFPHIVLGTLLAMRFHAPLRPDRPFKVHAELRGERVQVEVREADGRGDAGTLIAAGQWACVVGSHADKRA